MIDKKPLSYGQMRQLIYKKIFEKLNYFEEKWLEDSINDYLHNRKRMAKKHREALKSLLTILEANENGYFNEMKEKVKEKNLDYKSIYGVTETFIFT